MILIIYSNILWHLLIKKGTKENQTIGPIEGNHCIEKGSGLKDGLYRFPFWNPSGFLESIDEQQQELVKAAEEGETMSDENE